MYLRHASDEARHAQLFWQSANEQEAPQGPLDADGEDLFIDLGEAKFLAFVHHAELRGLEQFEIYRDYFTRRERLPLAERLQGICRDEEHHAAYSWKLLVELSGSVKEPKQLLRKIQLWEAWRSWKRSGRFLSLGIYTLLIWFLFPILLPYAILVRSFSRRPSGWQKAKPHG